VVNSPSVTAHLTANAICAQCSLLISFLIYLMYCKCESDTSVCDISESELSLELHPEVLILNPGTPV
jgi:hypothetical protein